MHISLKQPRNTHFPGIYLLYKKHSNFVGANIHRRTRLFTVIKQENTFSKISTHLGPSGHQMLTYVISIQVKTQKKSLIAKCPKRREAMREGCTCRLIAFVRTHPNLNVVQSHIFSRYYGRLPISRPY